MRLLAELKRRNVIRMSGLYLVGAWLILEVAETLLPIFDTPGWVLKALVVLLAVGLIPALVFSWVYELTPDGLKRDAEVDPASSIAPQTAKRMDQMALAGMLVLLTVIAADRYWPAATAPIPTDPDPGSAMAPATLAKKQTSDGESLSIAVLPFVNMSTDPENEFFADGLSEEILNALVSIERLRVTGRTSSFQFKGKNEDLRTIGAQLGVDHVLEGSVRRAGQNVRITAQLIRTADGTHLWSQTYDRDVSDIFKVQLDIATNVSESLGVILDETQLARMELAGIKDVSAFIDYRKATALFHEAHHDYINIGRLEQGYQLFSRALEREPGLARAYYERTDYYAHLLGQNTRSTQEHASLHARYKADLAEAAQRTTAPGQRALIILDSILISDDWRSLPAQIDTVLSAENCAEGVWVDVIAPFVEARRYLAWRQAWTACDPLNPSHLSMTVLAAMIAGDADEALRLGQFAEQRGLSQHGGGPDVLAMLILNDADGARRSAAAVDPWLRDFKELQIASFLGEKEVAIRARERFLATPRAATNISAETRIIAHALVGDRAAANAVAAELDRNPVGPLFLLASVGACLCGAAFDLEHTPRLRARLAEAGWQWPVPGVIQFKVKTW